jgi:hypothetical protein
MDLAGQIYTREMKLAAMRAIESEQTIVSVARQLEVSRTCYSAGGASGGRGVGALSPASDEEATGLRWPSSSGSPNWSGRSARASSARCQAARAHNVQRAEDVRVLQTNARRAISAHGVFNKSTA